MVLDTLAFSLAVILLATIIIMLAMGLSELPAPPKSTHCHRCSRWMLDTHRSSDAMCLRCRMNAAVHILAPPRG
ncbi:hypothetical protein KO481_33140 [Nocardia sp. NEAU-G5]|uniref:Uncharacterized protein n=1 Tax=Nocardia albiluteola TaxID=2842303 RepID=A0ABS6B899_9NOCA|nr:hypothetical protein [Nocardia albiluteola]MBU3066353.1 hypothetical protein [Nocardia albiluteola]